MSVKFKYPVKPRAIKSEDWNPLESRNDVNKANLLPNESPAPDQPAPEPPPESNNEEGLNRLVEILKQALVDKRAEQDPDARKKKNAINAYQKAAKKKAA